MKSMQRVSRGSGFGGAVRYAKDGGELIGGNMVALSSADLTREFGVVHRIRPDVKKPVWHQALRLPKGEKVTKEKWREIAADYMKRMGFSELNPHAIFLHDDPDGRHIHIVASRVALDSSLWLGQNENLTSTQVVYELEKSHGLRVSEMPDKAVKKDRKSLTRQEINMAVRTEMKPPRVICQEAIDSVLQLKAVMTAPQFIDRLAILGVRAVPSVASTGTMNGFSFEAEGIPFTGAKLGESYKWAKLQQRGIEYVKDRDFAALADARASARERAAAGPEVGPDQREAGSDSAPSAEPGAVAELGSGAGDSSTIVAGPIGQAAGPSGQGIDGIRPGDQGAAVELGGHGAGDQRSGDAGHGEEGRELGQGFAGSGQPGAGVEIELGSDAEDQHEPASTAHGAGHSSTGGGGNAGEQQPGSHQRGAERAPEPLADIGSDAGRGSVGGASGGGWASRFKQNSAAKRYAKERGVGRESLEPGNGKREKVTERDRVEARQIDPTDYLTGQGFQVIKEGRHLSVRMHSDEVYRVTRKDDGHWVTCDRFENGVGDNIALVAELEPGTGFAESVYRLSGAPSVVKATKPAPALVRQAPQMPTQTRKDVERGHAYLASRGISQETIDKAEHAGMLRYSAGGVLFVGCDEHGIAQNIMRRAVDASDEAQKRDLSGTDKRHPQMLRGAPETVLIVEGGADALAAHDLARRRGRPAPTVLVSGGANVRSFLQTPWVQAVLNLAKKVIVAFERESSAEAQAKTDAAHKVQMERLREVCAAQVTSWMPPEGIKDLAELNSYQSQHVEAAAAQKVAEAQQRAWERQKAEQPEPSHPMPGRG